MDAYIVTVQRKRHPLAPAEQIRRLRRGWRAADRALASELARLKDDGARVVSTVASPFNADTCIHLRAADGAAWRLEMREERES